MTKANEIRTDNTDTFKNALKKIVELTEENEQQEWNTLMVK